MDTCQKPTYFSYPHPDKFDEDDTVPPLHVELMLVVIENMGNCVKNMKEKFPGYIWNEEAEYFAEVIRHKLCL